MCVCVCMCVHVLEKHIRVAEKAVSNSTEFSNGKAHAGIGICHVNKMHKSKRPEASAVKRCVTPRRS